MRERRAGRQIVLNRGSRIRRPVAEVALIAATLIGVETTLYAVAVALYTILFERGRLSSWDRILVKLLGKPAIEDVASKVVSKFFSRAYVIIISVNYLIGLVGAFWSMLTEDLTGAFIG